MGWWKNVESNLAKMSSKTDKRAMLEVGYLGLSLLGSWLILRWALKQMDPNKNAKAMAKERKKALSRRLGRPVQLDGAYEDVMANEVINPQHIDVTLSDVGGLDHIIEDVSRNVITPMRHPELYRSSLLRQKRGVLLYGPPGTGKTMLAKALARDCGANFMLIKSSSILSKWYGDSNKLVSAVWSLAYKLQPCILFIDEVDSLLGQRSAQEHEATTAIKTEFMQLWEGFESGHAQILVLGATNRKERLDDAVLRRFSLQYEVQLPKAHQREAILRRTLRRYALEAGPAALHPDLLQCIHDPLLSAWAAAVGTRREAAAAEAARRPSTTFGGGASAGPSGLGGQQLPTAAEAMARADAAAAAAAPSSSGEGGEGAASTLRWLAAQTEGFSGSDLVQLCSQAAAVPIQEHIDDDSLHHLDPRPLSRGDFERVLPTFTPPSRAAQMLRAQRQRAGAGALAGPANGGAGGSGSGAGGAPLSPLAAEIAAYLVGGSEAATTITAALLRGLAERVQEEGQGD